jgi:hypothetical protein
MEGLWNPETDRYEPEGDQFTLLLKRDRLYGLDKQTPVHLGGDADEEFNRDKLIREREKRGRKVLRCARNVGGIFLHLSVFEIPPPDAPPRDALAQRVRDAIQIEEEQADQKRTKPWPAPQLRFIAFDPESGRQSVLMAPKEAVLEHVGGEFSPLLQPARRRELARALVNYLSLKNPHAKPLLPEICMPHSGDVTWKPLKVSWYPAILPSLTRDERADVRSDQHVPLCVRSRLRPSAAGATRLRWRSSCCRCRGA